MILNVGCGGRPTERNCWLGDVRLDRERLPPVNMVADAHHLPFRNHVFSGIVCFEVLEHLDSPVAAIREMARVLTNPHGSLFVTVPNPYYFKNSNHEVPQTSDHKQAWDAKTFQLLCYQGGLKVIRHAYLNYYAWKRRHPILGRLFPKFFRHHQLFEVVKRE